MSASRNLILGKCEYLPISVGQSMFRRVNYTVTLVDFIEHWDEVRMQNAPLFLLWVSQAMCRDLATTYHSSMVSLRVVINVIIITSRPGNLRPILLEQAQSCSLFHPTPLQYRPSSPSNLHAPHLRSPFPSYVLSYVTPPHAPSSSNPNPP